MIVAGWAWDDRLLMETVSRGAQADMVILLFAVSCLGLLFLLLSVIGGWLDRRAWRRDVARAHSPKPFDRERGAEAFDDLSDEEFDAYMKATQ